MNPAPTDLQLLAGLRLDACDSTSLMVEQYKVLSYVLHLSDCISPWHLYRQLSPCLLQCLLEMLLSFHS